jgi:lipoprotein-anchoring transpeptidase ErfK/SrfK
LASIVVALVAAAPASAQDPEPTIATGVTVSGLDVAGLTGAQATEAIQAFFDQPLSLGLDDGTISVAPANLGARARVAVAVATALAAAPDTALTLEVVVGGLKLRKWIQRRAKIFDRDAVSARARLVRLVPHLSEAKPGRVLLRLRTRVRLMGALRNHRRDTVALPFKVLRPKVSAGRFGPAVVIRRDSKRLILYRSTGPGAMRVVTSFPIATGMAAYPTPIGNFFIRTKVRHPWWYPPNRGWAAGAQPIPPGPGNPLGTRWMGLSVGGVGIHGTPDAASIGYSASHGCIRMRISNAEWLFERVRIGTPVFIVRA